MIRITTALLLLSVLLVLGGCETFRGLGKDMQRAGSWIEREAKRN